MDIHIHDWSGLSDADKDALLKRPASITSAAAFEQTREILAAVREHGDAALHEFSRRFDNVELDTLQVSEEEFDAATTAIDAQDQNALRHAHERLHTFHQAQYPRAIRLALGEGVICERQPRPIASVGLYVPGGSAPLPSTVLMLGVPAAIAACPLTILCTPPRPDGSVDPYVLFAARLCGITKVFKLGGAHAIAAMAYGSETVPRAAKLFGPGNSWVTRAKLLVAQDPDGAAIDMPAGPSEVLVIADGDADPRFVAADLLSQAEHGPDSQVLLVTTSCRLAEAVRAELIAQLGRLSRREIAARSLREARLIVVPDLDTALALSNAYAPEHLILQVREPRQLVPKIMAAGSVFVGPWSPEAIGDYCSGTNHVLPTSGYARSHSGLSVDAFMTQMTIQELTAAGISAIGATAERLARVEGLTAHAAAIRARLEQSIFEMT
jgi:histidinol dehydrogenase